MVQVGEQTGKTDEMLTKVAEYYDAEVDEAISAIIAAIEPLMTVFMGTVVLFIALSMFMPLFNIRKFLK
jgi:type IV pilus assembly protein PilC